MFRNNIKILFPFMLFFSLLVACSPSAKNELQYWENNKKAAAEFNTSYPAFKTYIDENLKAATPIAEAAIKLKDEKKKAAELQKANKTIKDGAIGHLNKIKSKKESLNKTIDKLAKLKLTKDKSKKRKKGMNAASEAIANVDKALNEAKPENKEGAMTLLKAQVDALISAQNSADSVYRSVKPKKKKKKKQTEKSK